MKFTYSTGDTPLDGFTIKRGLGRGGFGEVYFAVSDAGREVALKKVDFMDSDRGDSLVLNINHHCLLYTSPSPRDGLLSRMPSSA